ncbi:hypothetical protein [Aquabacterium humicola]|uniref:hypothetical protein n=1 Tax=Aquabacterium humicola TaxID=3237377 RepID=UPI0025427E2D|nr:hypothetical protein [Rubrivivax pictus]
MTSPFGMSTWVQACNAAESPKDATSVARLGKAELDVTVTAKSALHAGSLGKGFAARKESAVNGKPGIDSARVYQRKPICRSYVSVILASCEVDVQGTQGRPSRRVDWVLGCAADGEHEVCGVWSSASSGRPDHDAMLGDLRRAGLEQAGFVVDARALGSALGAVALPSVQRLLREAAVGARPADQRRLATIRALLRSVAGLDSARALAGELALAPASRAFAESMSRVLEGLGGLDAACVRGPRVADLVLRSDALAQDLHERLVRSVRRHGCFGGVGEALSFVEQVLENGLVRSAGVVCREVSHRSSLIVGRRMATVGGATAAQT